MLGIYAGSMSENMPGKGFRLTKEARGTVWEDVVELEVRPFHTSNSSLNYVYSV